MPKCRQVRATLREDSPARCNTLNRQVHNRVCSAFVIGVSVSNISTNEDAVDAAVPVDAQNAPTRDLETTEQFPQPQQRSSSVRKRPTQTEESPECQPSPGISHHAPQ